MPKRRSLMPEEGRCRISSRVWIAHFSKQWIGLPLVFGAVCSTATLAGGPVPPELGSFAPLDQDELVDHFTGDFRYSVPLMEVPGPNGGYPIALTYASGIAPDQIASWVGLGWTLSPGAIVRQMRGIPDEFSGTSAGELPCSANASVCDTITTTHDAEPNVTFGLGLGANFEFFGADSAVGTGLSLGLKGYFDNYRGFGISHALGLSGQVKSSGLGAGVGLNMTQDTLEGARVGASASLSLRDSVRMNADLAFDPYRGLSGLSVGSQYTYQNNSYLVLKGDASSFLGYAKPAALPSTRRPMAGENIDIAFKLGGEVYGGYINGTSSGFYSVERLAARQTVSKAFGFLHLDDAGKEDALDFNRERDGPIYDQTPNLAMPVLTNDLFAVSGHDVVGTFRAYRNDIPFVHDPNEESKKSGGAIGIDVGSGNLIKLGVNGVVNESTSLIGHWDGGNGNELQADPRNSFASDPDGYRERTYFKFIGELTASGNAPIDPVRVPLSPMSWLPTDTPPQYFKADAIGLGPPDTTKRVPRATLIQAFTYKELRENHRTLSEFEADFLALGRDAFRRDNHIGAFRITTGNGLRYSYGIAIYNTRYEEHKFSVDRSHCPAGEYCTMLENLPERASGEAANALYDYRESSTRYGSESFLEIKSISPYPTSYLLTAVLGPDYVDADLVPGPSDGDYGYWVKFNYERDPQLFKWRTPYLGAAFVRGPDNGRYNLGKERMRDKGYVTYGERESWYLSTVETATHKAFFCVDKTMRRDAIGAASPGQNEPPAGGVAIPWRLDEVRLFTKSELGPGSATRCTDLSPAEVPLVSTRLEYDASLVPGAPDHLGGPPSASPDGKLTLRKITFAHMNNTRAAHSPYVFEYSDSNDPAKFNPPYREGYHDRWSIYRVPPPAPAGVIAPPDEQVAAAEQTDARLDIWSSAWTLRRVVEPSGRIIDVEYEADDYAYVQDRPAARMFPLVSVDATRRQPDRICPVIGGSDGTGMACGPTGASPRRVYFQLESPLRCADATSCGEATRAVGSQYLGGAEQISFRIRVALKADPPGTGIKWQTISGYAGVVGAGIAPPASGDLSQVGWIELAPVHQDSPGPVDYHPFAHAAWQYLRLEQPELIRNGGINGDPNGDPIEEALGVLTLVDMIPSLAEMISGVYPEWAKRGWGQAVDLSQSFIRLQDPDGVKKGGGSRVRRISISDDWRASTGQNGHDLVTGYGYRYRLGDGRSSGVAAYEPMTGGDENALRTAKPFRDEVLLSSSYNLFSERPIGEAYYPAPSVGYARIVRHSLAAAQDIATQPPHPSSAGPTVYEYYTARDFPVRSLETDIVKHRNPFPQLVMIPLLGSTNLNSVTASQGYTTISNDMHGKLKRVTTFQYLDRFDPNKLDYVMREEPVQETTYEYRSTGGYAGSSSDLDNRDVPVLEHYPQPRDSGEETAAMAEQSDLVVDMRQNQTISWDAGINFNVDTFLVAYVSVPIPVPMPNFGFSLAEAKTVVTNRSVHRSGILESVSVRERSARITTRTLLLDPISGAPILTASDNAYGDPVYQLNLPARLIHARMGAAYDVVGRRIDLSGATASGPLIVPPANAITLCDELPSSMTPGCLPAGTELSVPDPAGGSGGVLLTLMRDQTGAPILAPRGDAARLILQASGPVSATAMRSGNRNLLTATSDSIKSLSNVLHNSKFILCRAADDRQVVAAAVDDVLSATRTTFSDQWPDSARDLRFVVSSPSATNALAAFAARDPYAQGALGIFRPSGEFVFVENRKQSGPAVDLRKDGGFTLVWFGTGDAPPSCPDDKWLRTRFHHSYSAAGFSAEEENALGVRSSTLYGQRGTVPTAIATNARRNEIAFEGFEAYDPGVLDEGETGEGNINFESPDCPLIVFCVYPEPYVEVTEALSHSGRHSLAIARDAVFSQGRLGLASARTYVISAWVSAGKVGSPEADVPTFASTSNASPRGVRFRFRVAPGGFPTFPGNTFRNVFSPVFEPSGPVIEGWQRITGTFVVPHHTMSLSLELLSGNGTQTGRPLYFDDVRIFPEDASFEGYVYDQSTLRLKAKLDENNFATHFGYAPNGKLELIRRETMRGVLTRLEGRMHLRERP